MSADIEKIMSPLALVCHREINCEHGGATVHCVVLADGFIIECGADGYYAPKRARLLAEAVNAFGPAKFDFRSRAHD